MKTLFLLALPALHSLLADASLGQDPPPTALPNFRFAFATGDQPAIAIAVVPGMDPLVLCSGNDAGGDAVTPQSLVPLLGLAKVLAADALHLQRKGKLDVGSGVKLGARELSLRELLEGTPLLPDYAVLDGGPGALDAAALQACGELVARHGVQLRPTSVGAAEFLLLEPIAFDTHWRDWPSMLRASLAPHVPGLDPLSADLVPDARRPRFLPPAEALPSLATAQPALLRTTLAVRDLAAWWHWRLQHGMPAWAGPRMGQLEGPPDAPDQQRWSLPGSSPAVSIDAFLYPGRKSGWIWIGPPKKGKAVFDAITRMKAFEKDLSAVAPFKSPVAQSASSLRLPATGPNALGGTRWGPAEGSANASACRLTFGATLAAPLQIELGGSAATVPFLVAEGETLTGSTPPGTTPSIKLWIRPLPDATAPTRLVVITSTSRAPTTVIPAGFELVPLVK